MPDVGVTLGVLRVGVQGVGTTEPNDYFTVAEYRAITGDRTVPYKAEDDDIVRAQQECIARLESYARSAWQVRSATEVYWCPVSALVARRIPLVEVTSLTLDGTALTLSDLVIDAQAGTVRWGDWSYGTTSAQVDGAGHAVIEYRYGFDGPVPQWVKRPMIQACQSLIREEEGGTKIPRNTTRYSSERTDLQIGRRGPYQPWPWDARASDDFQAVWRMKRPRPFASPGW